MSTHIIAGLKSLKLHGMAANYPDVAAQARHTDFTPDSFMHQLILSESADRSVRSTAYQMGAARFPAHRDLAGFAFEHRAAAIRATWRGVEKHLVLSRIGTRRLSVNERAQFRDNPIFHVPFENADDTGHDHRRNHAGENGGEELVLKFVERCGHAPA